MDDIRGHDSGKLEKICGVKIKYTPAEAGLAKCVSAFIKEKRPFKNISGRIQACMDKAAGETTPLRDIPTAKQKAAYFLIRHAPAAIAERAIKAARKTRGR